MTRVVFITQQVDPGHPALAATVPKIAALSRLVDEVVVLADGAVPGVLPENCRVRPFRAGTKAVRGARFETALAHELRGLRDGGFVLAHMCPIYAVLAAPLVRPLRIPLLLWFTHWKASRLLQAAERVSTAVVSVDRRSFPLDSGKVRAIGHGIDLAELTCAPARNGGDRPRLLMLGRYSRAKGIDVVLRAVAEVPGAELAVHGPELSEDESDHRAELEGLVESLGLGDRVALGEAVPRRRVPELLAASDALVNNMRPGAPDKVVYEAAACCVPVLASNPVFDTLLDPEQRFAREDASELAERIRALAALDPAARAELGRGLRERVEKGHSVESWARGVLAAAGAA